MQIFRVFIRFLSLFTATVLFSSGYLAGTSQNACAFEVQVSEAPTTDLSLTLGAFRNAKQSIFLNIYEFTSPDIAQVLQERILAGVQVQILQEGQLAAAQHLTAAAQGIQAELLKAMAAPNANPGDRLFQMTSAAGGPRRFRFDHAKYAVIDGDSVLLGSENYSPSGNPQPGTLGNRGWEVYFHEPTTAQQFLATFQSDTNLSSKDVQELDHAGSARSSARPLSTRPLLNFAFSPAPGVPTLSATSIMKITSPDTSLSGVLSLLNDAKKTIDIEQMTFDSAWKGSSNNRSPVLDAVLAAAKRGVRVRVLLNDESVFNHANSTSIPKNAPTVDLLSKNGVEAHIANIHGMGVDYIHNKGLLVDGDKTLVSSINWDENSFQNNREAAVALLGAAVFDHYEALFESDWKVSGGSN